MSWTEIEIPSGGIIGVAGESPQPPLGARMLILERAALAGEHLKAGQIGVAEPRPLTIKIGNGPERPRIASGCPFVSVNGVRLLARKWAILPAEETDDPRATG